MNPHDRNGWGSSYYGDVIWSLPASKVYLPGSFLTGLYPNPSQLCTVNLRWLLVLLLLPHFFLGISREYLEVPWTFLEIVALYGNIPGSCSGYLWLMPFLLSQHLPSNQHDNHLPLRLRPKQIWLSGYLQSVDSTLGVGWTWSSGHCAKFGS